MKYTNKYIHYRRSSADDASNMSSKHRNTEEIKLVKRSRESLFGTVNLNETVFEEYKGEQQSPRISKMHSSIKFQEMMQSPIPCIMPKTVPELVTGDIGALNYINESQDDIIEEIDDSFIELKSKEKKSIHENSIELRFSENSFHNSEEEATPIIHPYLDSFEQLLQIEKEASSDKIWRLVVNKPETKVYQRKVIDSPICMIKAFCEVKYSAKTVYTAIWDTSIRTKWDAVFNEFRLIDTTPHYEVLYYMIKTPFGITKRDWLQRRIEIHDYPEPGTIILHFCSMEHPLMPPKKGVIRAETLISGYVIRPTSENTCTVMIVSQNDIKGLIPKVVVNSFATKAPADWVNSMNRGCKMVAGY